MLPEAGETPLPNADHVVAASFTTYNSQLTTNPFLLASAFHMNHVCFARTASPNSRMNFMSASLSGPSRMAARFSSS
jgi:hypothetical protein